MSPQIALLVLLPAAAGFAAWLSRSVRAQLVLLLGAALGHVAVVGSLWLHLPLPTPGALLGLDALGLLVLTLASIIFLASALYSIPYLTEGTHDVPSSPLRYVPLLLAFLTAMSLVALSRHLGLLWASVEATTLASAPLIYFYRRPGSLEAAWKYLLICSVGIALALLGTFFLGVAAAGPDGRGPGLGIDALLQAAPTLHPAWLRAAFALALVGYGTKMGLAPLHTWLPDAHGQSPSPVSGLLSGALLNCALLGILRFYAIDTASGHAAVSGRMMLVLGFSSLFFGAASLWGQRDYKRLLAYSSVENMGIIAVGIGIGGAATYGGLLQLVNHGLAKCALFLLSGNVLRAYGTTSQAGVRGAARRIPLTAALLGVGIFAMGGAPPFGFFVSELTIFLDAMRGSAPWIGAAFIALIGIGFVAMARAIFPMLQGEDADCPVVMGRRSSAHRFLALGPPAALLALVLMLGLHVPHSLDTILRSAAALLGGSP
ncbi:MAG: proton-conducting transporter membrane subunit [Deltaproteobacteria bacterium]|nr:proton-conducting transporter membrane subunit [Deltaproteobacteria bacterium]